MESENFINIYQFVLPYWYSLTNLTLKRMKRYIYIKVTFYFTNLGLKFRVKTPIWMCTNLDCDIRQKNGPHRFGELYW
jgi:hypothetical protein